MCRIPVTIGILRDMAFQFYYEENLEALQQKGAGLVMINALQAEHLPVIWMASISAVVFRKPVPGNWQKMKLFAIRFARRLNRDCLFMPNAAV